jgi:hypothetical protein
MADLAPRYEIGIKDGDDSNQRNPSWCIAIAPFAEPAAGYDTTKGLDLLKTKDLLIIENDCLSVNINRPKGSFGKTASLTLKVTNITYDMACASGDWIFIWISDHQSDIDDIIDILKNKKKGNLNDFDSGLKFAGRILEIGSVDEISMQGVRILTQQVNCQMFLEMATSVYVSYLIDKFLDTGSHMPNTQANAGTNQSPTPSGTSNEAELIRKANVSKFISNSASAGLSAAAKRLLALYGNTTNQVPDTVIGALFKFTTGINRGAATTFGGGNPGATFNEAIGIPKDVAKILGRPKADKLWQLYNVIMGVHTYTRKGKPWQTFMPDTIDLKNPKLKDTDGVFWETPYRCKGYIPFYAPQWSGNSIWTILNEFLNPVVNEMYTALRINSDNMILPALIVREKPFGTGLFNHLRFTKLDKIITSDKIGKRDSQNAKTVAASVKKDQSNSETATKKVEKTQTTNAENAGINWRPTTRGMYHNLPRWVIKDSMINRIDINTSESDRVNLVLVWGRTNGNEFIRAAEYNIEDAKRKQFASGLNYYIDSRDVARNGLRHDVQESQFDTVNTSGGTSTQLWSKMRADWLFNGHLKLKGSISCKGIKAPICEGDNLEVQGVVYHIESISFNGSLSPNGTKRFETIIQVSNGLLAEGLDGKRAPLYNCHRNANRSEILPKDNTDGTGGPGYTDVQVTDKRNSTGEE